jgi:hypothetical protein
VAALRFSTSREMFNRDEPRLFVPKSFGWGYGLNLAALVPRRRRRRTRS